MISSSVPRSLQAPSSVARTHCTYTSVLFGWLPQTRLAHGPCLLWKDHVNDDLRRLLVGN